MPIVTRVKVHHPVKNQLVGRSFAVAGVGAGFEGTIGLRVLDARGREIATGSAQSAGGMAGMGEFSSTLEMESPPTNGSTVVLQAFGDNPGLPDEGPSPGFDLVEVPIIVFPRLRGWLLYRVTRGDTLTSIRRELRPFTKATVAHIVAANRRIEDPDEIKVGWKLRVPQID
jgi:nucleoid-associated protein YgaU